MHRLAARRPARALTAAAICVALAATVPALTSRTTDRAAADSPQARQVLTEGATERATPAPQDASAPVARVRHPGRRPAPVLPRAEHGQQAIHALGSKLPTVAARTGWSSAKLRSVLAGDDTAYVSDGGRVFYREHDVEQATANPQQAATTYAPVYPTSQTFTLHSHPSSTRKIFLDFDGANVSNTGWNGTGSGEVPNGTYTGFDLDGSPGTFSTAEHGYIQEVWREVSEIYAPFDVDVTTQDPGVAGITRSSSSDTSFGTHVVITSQSTPRADLCGSCLGVAWVGTFDGVDSGGYYQPAWVFDYSTSFDPMVIAQAAAHETGHTLGLSHDGTSTSPYYGGTAAWGPIMGSSMNRAVSQFSEGEYTDANNSEDDLQVIQNTGLPLRPDDHVGTTSLGQHSSYSVSGIIGTRTDTDDFSVNLPCTTTLSASAKGIGPQSTLDIALTVLDAQGHTVATSSPLSTYSGNPPVSAGMNASVSVPNATGTYVLRVDGVGNGSPLLGGWSDYDSLGQYTLTATGCDTTGTPSASPTDTPTSTATPTDGPTDAPTSAPPSTPPPAATPTTRPTPAKRHPSAPRIGGVTPGPKHGAKTVTVRWAAPRDDGGAPLTSYRIQAQRIARNHRVRASYVTRAFRASTRAVVVRLPAGSYRFRVEAANSAGGSPWSAYSRTVKAR